MLKKKITSDIPTYKNNSSRDLIKIKIFISKHKGLGTKNNI